MTTRRETDIINAERERMADQMTEKLQGLGIEVRIAHYTGDSSYPTEYTISYQGITEVGPTFDLALMGWVEKLAAVVKNQPEDKSHCTIMGTSTQMAGSEHERKTYLMTLHDGEKEIKFNLQVHADGGIVAEPRPIHETDYDDLDSEEDEDDDPGDYDEYAYLADDDEEEEG